MEILSRFFLGNTFSSWLLASLVALGVFLGFRLVQYLVINRVRRLAQKTRSDLDDFLSDLVQHTSVYFLLALALYAGALMLVLPAKLVAFLRTLAIIAALIQTALWGLRLIDFLTRRRIRLERGARSAVTTMGVVSLVAKVSLWSIVILLILENITGIQVDTLIASLGITGIAVALAVQSILGDILASLTIALDKPFVIGDVIQVGEFLGTVEHIGLKSTRLRSITGEQIIFANSDLLNSRIRNLKRMENRQVVFTFGVAYVTPNDKLAQIPVILQEIVAQQPRVSFERAHLKELGSHSIVFECAYTVQGAELLLSMDIQNAVQLALHRRLGEEGIQFAYQII